MADVLMVAKLDEHKLELADSEFRMTMFPIDEFRRQESLYKEYQETLWKNFRSHGKHARIENKADWALVMHGSRREFLGCVLVVEVGPNWLIEYVMVVPDMENRGLGGALMARVCQEAKQRLYIKWMFLHCDAEKENGKLLHFYGKFGFKVVS